MAVVLSKDEVLVVEMAVNLAMEFVVNPALHSHSRHPRVWNSNHARVRLRHVSNRTGLQLQNRFPEP